jgi:hypothetical protein
VCLTYLDLQNVVTSDPLVMHVVIGIIGIPAVLVLDKREPDGGGQQTAASWCLSGWGECLQPARSTTRRRDVASDEPTIAVSYDVSIVKQGSEMDRGSLGFCGGMAASRYRRDPGWMPLTGDLPGAKPSAIGWKRSVIADRSIEGWRGRDDGGQGGGMARRWIRHDGG